MAVFLCFFLVLVVASCSAAGDERCVRQGKAAYAPSLSPLPQGRCAYRSTAAGRFLQATRVDFSPLPFPPRF
jgi:hypothetical protein